MRMLSVQIVFSVLIALPAFGGRLAQTVLPIADATLVRTGYTFFDPVYEFLEVDADVRAYIKFDLPDLSPSGMNLVKATLVMRYAAGSPLTPFPDCMLVEDTRWEVESIPGGVSPDGDIGPLAVPTTYYEYGLNYLLYDATSFVVGPSEVLFVLSSELMPRISFYSRDAAPGAGHEHRGPYLLLEFADSTVKGEVAASWGSVKSLY